MPPESVSEKSGEERAFDLVRSLRERDIVTFEHSRRVATYARRLAYALGQSRTELRQYIILGLLHDIGKMWVGDILTKDGTLSDDEYERIKSHATVGEKMIVAYDLPEKLAKAVRHHHEAYDGHGYPDGLVGDGIPLEARVITIADAFDVITSDRPYKKAAELPEAIAEIAHNMGKQFDPQLAQIFVGLASRDPHFKIEQRICPVNWARRGSIWYQIRANG